MHRTVLLLTLALAMVACSAPVSLERRSDQPVQQPKRGGYLKHLLPYSANNIDPYTTDDATGYAGRSS